MPRIGLCSVILLLTTGLASAPTTQPALALWARAVEQLAQTLTQGDPAALADSLADDARIHSLDGRNSDPLSLLSRTRMATVVAARAYVHAPPDAAADIAAALQNADVPDEIKRYMTPQDDAQMARANAAASRWLTETLPARDGDLVALIVLWSAQPAPSDQPNPTPEVIFVLVKGGTAGSGARVQAIAYGNPRRPDERSD